MANPRYPDTATGSDRESRVPRWLKISLITAAVVALLVVLVMLVSGGEHGPGRHGPGGQPPASVNHTPPAGPGVHTGPPPGAHG